nr:hypothetical protein Iba_chr06cCG5440 [Ipomoea batatas]
MRAPPAAMNAGEKSLYHARQLTAKQTPPSVNVERIRRGRQNGKETFADTISACSSILAKSTMQKNLETCPLVCEEVFLDDVEHVTMMCRVVETTVVKIGLGGGRLGAPRPFRFRC